MYEFDLVLFCKTCLKDKENLIIQADSIKKYNKEHIPYYISVREDEYEEFSKIKKKHSFTYEIILDENVSNILTENEYHSDKYNVSYINQQLVKLEFYKTNIAKHYVVIDSDCYFIKNFGINDFLVDSDTPYLPLTERLKGDRNFWSLFLIGGTERNKKSYLSKKTDAKQNVTIEQFIGRNGKYFTIEMPFVITSEYMADFETVFLKQEKNMTISELLVKYPSEMQLYCNYLLKKHFKYQACNALFLPNHLDASYQILRWLGFDEQLISQNYIGILMNDGYVKSKKFKSNWIGKHIIRNIIKFHHKISKQRTPIFIKLLLGIIPIRSVRIKLREYFR